MQAVDTPERLARFLCTIGYPSAAVEATVIDRFPDRPAQECRDAVTTAVAARERAEAEVESEIDKEGRHAAS